MSYQDLFSGSIICFREKREALGVKILNKIFPEVDRNKTVETTQEILSYITKLFKHVIIQQNEDVAGLAL